MKQKQYIVALEIGSSKVVGAVAEKTASGSINVQYLEEEKQINCVRYGCVQNVETIKSCINHILRKLENALDGTISQVYVGLSGRSVHSEASEVNRSVDASKTITRELIDSIIREVRRTSVKKYETVGVVPRTFYVDKKETENIVGEVGSSIKMKVNLIVANPLVKQNLERAMAMGPEVKNYYITALAMGQHVLTTDERKLGCMLVDMGAETTTVSIYKKNALVYLNTLPLGGRTLTKDVANACNVLEETAERIKKNINNPLDLTQVDSILIEGINSRDAANYINARTGEILANVNKQLEYAEVSTNDLPSGIIIAGGASQLKGMLQKMEDTTKLKVRTANCPNSLNITNSRINKHEYIEVLALLAEAAQNIDPMDSCVELHSFNDDNFDVQSSNTPVQQPQFEEPKPQVTRKSKPGLLERLKDRFNNFMTDPEEGDEP